MTKLLQGDELETKARELGVDTQGGPITQSVSGRQKRADDSELQRRVIEAERSIRESKLWQIAVISAVAAVFSAVTSLISAIAAFMAVAR
jgi:hypothetical protein